MKRLKQPGGHSWLPPTRADERCNDLLHEASNLSHDADERTLEIATVVQSRDVRQPQHLAGSRIDLLRDSIRIRPLMVS